MESLQSPVDGTRIAFRVFRGERGLPGPVERAAGETRPTALLVHGTALSQAIWRGFGYTRALAPTHDVVTVDLRGHGRSGGPHDPDAYDPDRSAADLVAVLDRTATPLASHVGYSLGARIGFSLVTGAAGGGGGRIDRFVSIAGAPGISPGAFDRVFFPGCVAALREGGMAGFLDRWEAHGGTRLDAATRHAFSANDPLALAAYMTAQERDRGVDDDTLRSLDIPCLLVVGSLDPERVASARHVASVVPSAAPPLVVAGATHGTILRDPATRDAVVGFLDHNAP